MKEGRRVGGVACQSAHTASLDAAQAGATLVWLAKASPDDDIARGRVLKLFSARRRQGVLGQPLRGGVEGFVRRGLGQLVEERLHGVLLVRHWGL